MKKIRESLENISGKALVAVIGMVTVGIMVVSIISDDRVRDQQSRVSGSQNETCQSNTPPAFTVTHPNGGEAFVFAWRINIQWTSCNIPEETLIDLELVYRDPVSGVEQVYNIVDDPNTPHRNDHQEWITIPDTEQVFGIPLADFGPYFKIRIGADAHEDYSDDSFTIRPPHGFDDGTDTQYIELEKGWNIISSHIEPNNPDIAAVFSSIVGAVKIVRDEDNKWYKPHFNPTINNQIGDWDVTEGYRVKMREPRTLTITGTRVDSTTPIPIEEGWNIISYLPHIPLDAVIALDDIADDFIIIKDYIGNAYIPIYGINTIGDLEPGQGYKIKADHDTTLLYPESNN